MRVLLLDKIYQLGDIGDEVSVRAGYARNYLLPQKKAVMATPENIRYFEERRAELKRRAEERLRVAEEHAERLQALGIVTVEANVDENGEMLYGSVGPREIKEALAAVGEEVGKDEIILGEPLRKAGEHEVQLRLHGEVVLPLTVAIVPRH